MILVVAVPLLPLNKATDVVSCTRVVAWLVLGIKPSVYQPSQLCAGTKDDTLLPACVGRKWEKKSHMINKSSTNMAYAHKSWSGSLCVPTVFSGNFCDAVTSNGILCMRDTAYSSKFLVTPRKSVRLDLDTLRRITSHPVGARRTPVPIPLCGLVCMHGSLLPTNV